MILIPALTTWESIGNCSDAGPIVATIFVKGNRFFNISGFPLRAIISENEFDLDTFKVFLRIR
jgi:hypothetical protein